ncbi:N-methyl-L-tryptophan oxidase [Pseudoroseomonas rhizosphaerae]|uniref:N-methyl-L-tryptophan oxidase n=1 Tax=Teichococcus rhizosphaerae TaxID=1335062 RepID=A0A2C7A469_9PROT|nr:N-methyl-L-tryptophan oxidase [Pseudoroseomonas rhizosphaerae]PHK94858.1 N-methyl-L-tryptophan oxidase [Pseudoroseomonas rhizosphaerae]
MPQHYDSIVIGMGGMGSAALWQLARRGQRVLGLERFDLGHAMGSSHGLNRIIRLAYFEHPGYVPLLRRAYELWRETEALAGEQLLFVTGSLDAGPEEGRIVQGSLAACRAHGLPHEALSAAEVNRRFPGYRLPADYAAIHQPDGGFIASERAILAHASLAVAAGAEIHARERVLAIEPAPGRVTVVTERGRYEAGRVIAAAGAWIEDLVPGLRGQAVPERQVLGWFQPRRPALFAPGAFPVSNMETAQGHFYQFPSWGIPGFKIGLYHHFGEHGHADALSREPTARDEAALREAVRAYFPEADGPTLRLAACLFTNTPDEHFVLDTLPGHPEVVVASPCSGHGYKFASVIGEVLAELATTGRSRHDLSLFSCRRLAAG